MDEMRSVSNHRKIFCPGGRIKSISFNLASRRIGFYVPYTVKEFDQRWDVKPLIYGYSLLIGTVDLPERTPETVVFTW